MDFVHHQNDGDHPDIQVPNDNDDDDDENNNNNNNNDNAGREPKFPEKLHFVLKELENDGLDDIMSWQPGGRCFLVHNKDRMITEVLPLWFRQSRYSSFLRQLNMYGFKRITTGPNKGAYWHRAFLRSFPDLARHIERRRRGGDDGDGDGVEAAEDDDDPAAEEEVVPPPAEPQAAVPPAVPVVVAPVAAAAPAPPAAAEPFREPNILPFTGTSSMQGSNVASLISMWCTRNLADGTGSGTVPPQMFLPSLGDLNLFNMNDANADHPLARDSLLNLYLLGQAQRRLQEQQQLRLALLSNGIMPMTPLPPPPSTLLNVQQHQAMLLSARLAATSNMLSNAASMVENSMPEAYGNSSSSAAAAAAAARMSQNSN